MAIPDKPLAAEKTTTTILAPDGSVANFPTVLLSTEEAKLLREYKKFLVRHGYKEALYCVRCFEQNLHHGCKAFVTTDQVLVQCRCRVTFYQGATY